MQEVDAGINLKHDLPVKMRAGMNYRHLALEVPLC